MLAWVMRMATGPEVLASAAVVTYLYQPLLISLFVPALAANAAPAFEICKTKAEPTPATSLPEESTSTKRIVFG
jgi:hypothetical protein